MSLRILFISPLGRHSGNHTTATRIASLLEAPPHHYQVTLRACTTGREGTVNPQEGEECDVVLALHAFHSAPFCMSSQKPYVLILGGTDVNEMSQDPEKASVMLRVVKNATAIVCFSQALREKAVHVWGGPSGIHPASFVVIPQSVQLAPITLHTPRPSDVLARVLGVQKDLLYTGRREVFLLPMGVRAVKDPLFLVHAVGQLESGVVPLSLVIVGPILCEDTGVKLREAIAKYSSRIFYHPALELADLHCLFLSEAIGGIVNTSKSEGQPQVILEAMATGMCPVFVRDIPGNTAVVSPDRGYVFQTAEDFVNCVVQSRKDVSDCAGRVSRAKEYVDAVHNGQTEQLAYASLLKASVLPGLLAGIMKQKLVTGRFFESCS